MYNSGYEYYVNDNKKLYKDVQSKKNLTDTMKKELISMDLHWEETGQDLQKHLNIKDDKLRN